MIQSWFSSGQYAKVSTHLEDRINISSFLKAAIGHLLLLFSLYYLLYFLGQFTAIPTSDTVIQWDAGWYHGIFENGYVLMDSGKSNVAFFPLFPKIWNLLDLSPLGICVLNTFVFYIAFFVIAKIFRAKIKEILLCLSIASVLFFMLPYAESFFFLSGTLILIGYQLSDENQKGNWRFHGLIFIGLFLASMTRPSMLFFFPAILFVEIINLERLKISLLKVLFYSLAVCLGMFAVVWYQYEATGEWFAFFSTQSDQWDNKLQLPKLPFRTWGGSKRMWLDGAAFSVTLVALIYCIRIFYLKLKGHQSSKLIPSKASLFSLVYLSMAGIFTVFFHGEDPIGGTTLMGINRYVFATPFFFLTMLFLLQKPILEKKSKFGFGVFFMVILVIIGSFAPSNFPNHLRTIAYFLIIIIFLLFQHRRFSSYIWILFYMINLVLQVHLVDAFLNGKWVG